MKFLLAFTCALTLPLAAFADAQQDRASTIEHLSETFSKVTPENDLFLAAPTQTAVQKVRIVLQLDGCEITQVEMAQNLFSGTYQGAVVIGDLAQMTLQEIEGGPIGQVVQDYRSSNGQLQASFFYMQSNVPVRISIHDDLTEAATAQDVIESTATEVRDTLQWRYVNDAPNEGQVATLVEHVLAYQRDYCTLGS